MTLISRRPGERVLHLFFVGENLLHAGALLDALEMGRAVREPREVEIERQRAPETPEEVCVRGGEVVEEKLASGEQAVGDRKILEQQPVADPLHAFLGA